MNACHECGMVCHPNEYHPYAACLMFRGCHDADTVRANLIGAPNEPKPVQPGWTLYQRVGSIEARPYEPDDRNNPRISISMADALKPLDGGMVARNPANHDDLWYIAREYFAKHYGSAPPPPDVQPRVTYAKACALLAELVVALSDRERCGAEMQPQYMAALNACLSAMGHDRPAPAKGDSRG